MTEISINPISTVRAADSSPVPARAAESPGVPARAAPSSQVESSAAAVTSAKLATAIQEKAPAPKPAETASAPLVGNASNVSLQFRVDAKTKDVTVFVVDRNSKKVLRSIPANELAKLSAGDLLSLTR